MNGKCLILLTVIITFAKQTSESCDACLEGICYYKRTICDKYEGFGQIIVDSHSNTLFLQFEDDDGDFLDIGYNLEEDRVVIIPDIPVISISRTIDQDKGTIYIGTPKGIYQYGIYTKKTKFLGFENRNVFHTMQFRKKLYFSTLPHGICTIDKYMYCNCITALKSIEIDDFVVDKFDDIYYKSGNYVFRLYNNSDTPQYLFPLRFGKLGVDNYGEVYIIVLSKITKLNYENDKFIKIGFIRNTQVYEWSFDKNNNIIFIDIKSTKTINTLVVNPHGKCYQ